MIGGIKADMGTLGMFVIATKAEFTNDAVLVTSIALTTAI
jgi:hypothetical protein